MLFVTGIIDYNFLCFREAIQQVFELRNKSQVLVALSTNHHSNVISSQNTTLNSETQNTTLNSTAVQSWRHKDEPVILLISNRKVQVDLGNLLHEGYSQVQVSVEKVVELKCFNVDTSTLISIFIFFLCLQYNLKMKAFL